MPIAHPLTRGQAAHQRLVQPAWVAIVDILDTGGLPEFRLVQTRLQPAILPGGALPIHQQAQAFFKGHLSNLGHLHLLHERVIHPHQFQGLEFVERGMSQHWVLLVM